MSPEQVNGKPTDHRSDIFSLGCVLYEMLSGRRAFARDTAAETMTAILKEDPPEITDGRLGVSPSLERILRHCLEKDPAQRFQSARDLAFDLEAVAGASGATTGTATAGGGRTKRRAGYAALALLVLAVAFLAGRSSTDGPSRSQAPTIRQLTFGRGTIRAARFAPDGQTIVFGAAWDGEPVPDPSGQRRPTPIKAPDADMLSLSRSGEMAVSVGHRFDMLFLGQGALARMPLLGGAPRALLEGVADADWTLDGAELAVVRRSWGRDVLEFPIGRALHTGTWISYPRFSPDGDRIAFVDHRIIGNVRLVPGSSDVGRLTRTANDREAGLPGLERGGFVANGWVPLGVLDTRSVTEHRGCAMLDWLRYDIRHAVRGLVRDRSFTVIAVLSIALGVGANAAIFSLVDQALFRPLSVHEPERLVLLNWKGTFVGNGWGSGNLLPHPMFRDLKAENHVFEGLLARHPTEVNLSVDGTPEPVKAEIVSGSYFGVLGVKPARGRLLEESDDVEPGSHPVVVVSHDYWRNRLGGSDDVVGRSVRVNGFPMTVIGVAAAGFRGMDWGEVPALWLPTMMKKQATPEFDWLDDRRGRWLHVFGRLEPGISSAQAEASLQPWFKAMLQADTQRVGWPRVTDEEMRKFLASSLELLPAANGRSDLRRRLEQPLLVLLAATVLVLLLACLNVANLFLARAFARRRETAVRLALGASRRRIVRELLGQSALIALGGALLGLFLAPAVSAGLIAFLPKAVDLHAGVDRRVFAFALLTAVSTGLLFGLAPAVRASRTQPGFTLKEDGSRVAGGLGLRKALVVGQIALALVLLVGAGLFVRTLQNLRARGPGFETTNLVTFGVDPSRAGYGAERSKALLHEVLRRLRALPEVQHAAASGAFLLGPGSWNTRLTIDSTERFALEDAAYCNAVSDAFFETLGASIVSGRGFDEHDASDDSKGGFRTAVVNERFAKRYFGDHSPLGARLGFGVGPDVKPDIEIVGVVKTFSYRARGLRDPEEQVFFPFFQGSALRANLYVRTRTSSSAAFATMRSAVRSLDPALPVYELRTLDDQLDQALANERLLAILATAFAGLALLLAAIGLYGVTSFVVSRRTREIGIRMALGATRAAALGLVARDTAVLVIAGLAIAVPIAWSLGRLIESQLFGVKASDGGTVAGCAALLALAAFASAAVPARRATNVNPVEALRCE